MKKVTSSLWVVIAALLAVTVSSNALAKGGFLSIDDAAFDATSNVIDNSWWALPAGTRFTYFAEDGDECSVVYEDVLPTAAQSRVNVDGVAVREVLDEAWIDEDCDMIPDRLHESTLDWYAQDTEGNVWYFGEDTVAFEVPEDECEHPIAGPFPDGTVNCADGSWEAGEDVAGVGTIAKEGILMLDDPTGKSGVFYFQEFYEGEALDMAKILNYKKVDTYLYGEQDGCVRIKEYSPLAPGAIEHKTYCDGFGLVLVEENSGGKTVFETLIDVGATP